MIVNNVVSTPTYTTTPPSTGKSDLGKDDFLKLMILQMQNQDPLEPMKNEDFIAQLAQFNSLEQMQNLNKTTSTLGSLQTLTQTASLIGKTAAAQDADGTQFQGTIKQVFYKDGVPELAVYDQQGAQHLTTVDNVLGIA